MAVTLILVLVGSVCTRFGQVAGCSYLRFLEDKAPRAHSHLLSLDGSCNNGVIQDPLLCVQASLDLRSLGIIDHTCELRVVP